MSETLMKGTLRLLVFADGVGACGQMFLLAWTGQPEGASAEIGSDLMMGSVELGDEDMDPLPSTPDAPGLWLLAWDYEMRPCEEQWGDDEIQITAKYASECQWTRPSMNDLSEMGALG